MYKRPLNIDELKEYWNIVDGGESIENLPICYMPPWNDICSKLEWELHLTDDGYFPKKTHAVCGGYRLVGLASEGDLQKLATLHRACGTDTSGTLYIGQAGELHTRANLMLRRKHQAIRILNQIPLLDFPPARRAIALLSTIQYPKVVERDMLHAYMNSFGDTPPLNYTI
jgi:hypothetical protein